jgi:hypothetical protein
MMFRKNLPLMTLKPFKLLLLVLAPVLLHAQNYHRQCHVQQVSAPGFYRILLTPEITGQMKSDLSDIRLFDEKDTEIPYLLYKDTAHRGVDRFVSYEIVEKEYKQGCCSHIVVKNTLANSIEEIMIEVNSADSRRNMTLSGSYDNKQWFALKDRFDAVDFDSYEKGSKKTTSLLKFSFPKSDYTYYKFDFDDWKGWWNNFKYPVFIVKAGYIEPTFIPEETQETPSPALNQAEDRKVKQSLIHLSFPEAEYVDHLRIDTRQAEEKQTGYYRAASVYELVKKDSLHTEERFLGSTILSSLSENEFNLHHTLIRNLLVRISNLDDQPLQITGVHGFQVKHYLVANLGGEIEYYLKYGCDTLNTPQYDLQHFRDKVPALPPVLSVSGYKDIYKPAPPKEGQKASGFFNNKSVIWIAIVLVGLLLAFMVTRMLKEMNK